LNVSATGGFEADAPEELGDTGIAVEQFRIQTALDVRNELKATRAERSDAPDGDFAAAGFVEVRPLSGWAAILDDRLG
jgi:hypothetical protein